MIIISDDDFIEDIIDVDMVVVVLNTIGPSIISPEPLPLSLDIGHIIIFTAK